MQEKLSRFIQSHFGHVVLAFALYCVFMFAILFSLNAFVPQQGVNGFADGVSVNLEDVSQEDIDLAYSRRIKLAVIVGGMGLSEKSTAKAIEKLPNDIGFAFSPYSEKLDYWFSESRKFNHELLLEIPMEPEIYPENDPGPIALLTRHSDTRNIAMLKSIMRKANGYDGLMTWMGDAFMTSGRHLKPVLEYLKKTDLFFLDTVPNDKTQMMRPTPAIMAKEMNLPYVQTQFILDEVATREHILSQLDKLERSARIGPGYAVALAHYYPVTIDVLIEWEATLKKKNISLVSVKKIAESIVAGQAE